MKEVTEWHINRMLADHEFTYATRPNKRYGMSYDSDGEPIEFRFTHKNNVVGEYLFWINGGLESHDDYFDK